MTNDHGRTAVYRLYDTNGTLLYVGSSNNPPYRYSEHSRSPLKTSWWPQVARKHETWYDQRTEAQQAEAEAIKTENPLHNTRLTINARNRAIGTKFSEAEAALIDAARGTTSRSEWLRTATLTYARRLNATTARADTHTPEPERKPKNCKHPNFRGVKGVCPDCQEWIGK
jgi:excinuclease UvrABC nuclease subunit